MGCPVINLEDFALQQMDIKWLFPSGKEEVIYIPDFDFSVFVNSDETKYRIDFLVSFCGKGEESKKKAGYELDVLISGIFTFPEEIDEQQREYLIRVNGATILYGILRGIVTNVTSNFPGGKFLLPTVMMEEVIKSIIERKASEAETFDSKNKRIVKK